MTTIAEVILLKSRFFTGITMNGVLRYLPSTVKKPVYSGAARDPFFFFGCRQVQFNTETGNSDPRDCNSFPVNTEYVMPRFRLRSYTVYSALRDKYTLRTLTRFVFYVMLVKASFCALSLPYGNVTKVRLSCACVKWSLVGNIRMKSKFA